MIASISSGHDDAADLLLLLAFVLFLLDWTLALVQQRPTRLPLTPLGLAALALGLFVA